MLPTQLRYALPSAAAIVSALGFALPAHAFNFKVSGQVDRAVVGANNGEDQDYGFVDNGGSNTRFRFTGDQDMGNGLKLGFVYEIGLGVNPSGSFDINEGGGNGETFLDNRLANVYLQGAFGKVTFGKVDQVADGTSEVDFSGNAGLGGGIDIEDYAGGITFLDNDGNDIAQVGDAFNEFDGLSRQNGLRYDTPSFGGLVLSAGLDNGHAYETAARYSKTFDNGFKFGAAADYLDSESIGRVVNRNGSVVISPGGRFQEYGGSASILLPIGLNVSVAGKHRKYIDSPFGQGGYTPDTNNFFGGVGYIIGKHHIELTYNRTNDFLNDGSKLKGYGASYVYNWTDSIELYASYHRLKLDDAQRKNDAGVPTGDKIDAQDLNVIYLGTRLKFL